MTLETFDRWASRAQIPFTIGGYIGWAYTLWPKGGFMSPTAYWCLGLIIVGLLGVLGQVGLISRLFGTRTGARVESPLQRRYNGMLEWKPIQYEHIANQTFVNAEIILD